MKKSEDHETLLSKNENLSYGSIQDNDEKEPNIKLKIILKIYF